MISGRFMFKKKNKKDDDRKIIVTGPSLGSVPGHGHSVLIMKNGVVQETRKVIAFEK
jgi:hypothetical protein